MKKSISIGVCFLLTGCAAVHNIVLEDPEKENIKASKGISYPYQDVAPWPWVHIIPSERAIAYKDVNFSAISNQFHYDISFYPYRSLFRNVYLILLDYTLLAESKASNKCRKVRYKGKLYTESGEIIPERYIMTASFFERNKRPPSRPLYEITASLSADRAASQEAMRMMAHDIIREIHVADRAGELFPGWKMSVNLDW